MYNSYPALVRQINRRYYPHKILLATAKPQDYPPLFENRLAAEGKTTVYVCFDNICRLPAYSAEDIWKNAEA